MVGAVVRLRIRRQRLRRGQQAPTSEPPNAAGRRQLPQDAAPTEVTHGAERVGTATREGTWFSEAHA
jgi:hypothetical protein